MSGVTPTSTPGPMNPGDKEHQYWILSQSIYSLLENRVPALQDIATKLAL